VRQGVVRNCCCCWCGLLHSTTGQAGHVWGSRGRCSHIGRTCSCCGSGNGRACWHCSRWGGGLCSWCCSWVWGEFNSGRGGLCSCCGSGGWEDCSRRGGGLFKWCCSGSCGDLNSWGGGLCSSSVLQALAVIIGQEETRTITGPAGDRQGLRPHEVLANFW
jgi:hypothetical protein